MQGTFQPRTTLGKPRHLSPCKLSLHHAESRSHEAASSNQARASRSISSKRTDQGTTTRQESHTQQGSMAGEGWKTNADTTKMSPEEVEKLGLQGSKRPPGHNPGGVLHQRSGVSLQKAGAYPVALAGVIVLAGVATWGYYHRHLSPEQKLPGRTSTSE